MWHERLVLFRVNASGKFVVLTPDLDMYAEESVEPPFTGVRVLVESRDLPEDIAARSVHRFNLEGLRDGIPRPSDLAKLHRQALRLAAEDPDYKAGPDLGLEVKPKIGVWAARPAAVILSST